MIAVAILLFSVSLAIAGELPLRYYGDWSNGQRWVQIRQNSYESDSFRCQFASVIEGPRMNLEAYKVEMTCWIVDEPRPRKLQAVLGLRDINGKKVLIIASHSTNYPSIDVLVEAEQTR
jgi:hypothetical protein